MNEKLLEIYRQKYANFSRDELLETVIRLDYFFDLAEPQINDLAAEMRSLKAKFEEMAQDSLELGKVSGN